MSLLSDLRQSTNETARVARANLLLFLVVGLFLALLIAATDDMLLLKRARMELPLMQIGVPIDLFYGAAPVIFALLHLNLLLRLNRLAHVAALLRQEIEKLGTPAEQTTQTALLFPFDFLQVLLYTTGRPSDRRPPPFWQLFRYLRYEREKYGHLGPLLLIVALPIFVLPVVLLTWIQLCFLPYQSELITFIHQGVIAADIAALAIFCVRLGVFRKLRTALIEGPSPLERLGGALSLAAIPLLMIAFLAMSWLIAVVPDSRLERNHPFPETQRGLTLVIFEDWWQADKCRRRYIRSPGTFRRYLYIPGTSIAASERPAGTGPSRAPGTIEREITGKLAVELDISRRSLRYAWFEGSAFRHTTFAESDLHCSNFKGSSLQGVVFDGAQLHGAQFDEADLRKASLEDVRANGSEFDDADLRDAQLTGARFRGGSIRRVRMQGAVARQADFYGTDLRQTKFHGADMAHADFFGVDLDRAQFFGADLKRTEFRGATLAGTQFYGVDLNRARIQAVNGRLARFYWSDLGGSKVTATSLYGARFFGNNMKSLDVHLSDLRGARWEEPENRPALHREIDDGLRRRGLDPEARRKFLDEMDRNARRGFYSRGLDRLKQPACAWTDRSGPFRKWSAPEPACWKELESYLVKSACSGNNRGVGAGIVAAFGFPKTWIEANSALGLLETDPDECGPIEETHRGDICQGLTDWFGTEDEEGRRGDAAPPAAGSALEDRWNKAKAAGLCPKAS